MSRRTVLPVVVVASLVTAVTACSAPSPYNDASSGGPSQLAEPDRTVLVANSTARLGTVVIDGLGWTLYRHDSDSAKPPKSTCADKCATDWPPVVMQPGTPEYEGVDPTLVGTVTRADGTKQVTIGGWPVYRHAADSQPGSVDGQGADGGWWAVTPTGGRATQP